MSAQVERAERIARTLRNDYLTSYLVGELAVRDIRVIVLKGPATRALLYEANHDRVSNDIDLLVDPDELSEVEDALPALGFEFLSVDTLGAGRAHDRLWLDRKSNTLLELHVTMKGVGVAPERLWRILSASTVGLELSGATIEVLNLEARVLHVVLNAAHHGRSHEKGIADLERAIRSQSIDVWRRTAELAVELEAQPAFAAGLRLHPAGAGVMRTLDLHWDVDTLTLLRAETAPPLAQGFDYLMGLPTARARLRLVIEGLVPSRQYMEFWWPPARRGGVWLMIGYCWRPIWISARIGPAVLAWRRARRASHTR
jgi:hypothetical protein